MRKRLKKKQRKREVARYTAQLQKTAPFKHNVEVLSVIQDEIILQVEPGIEPTQIELEGALARYYEQEAKKEGKTKGVITICSRVEPFDISLRFTD